MGHWKLSPKRMFYGLGLELKQSNGIRPKTKKNEGEIMGDVEDMIPLVIEALRELGGSARLIDISKYIWQHYQNELEIAGDLFYRWQYILRWVGTQLRNDGIMLPAAESPSGLWVLAP